LAELGIHRDDAETILRELGEIEALQPPDGCGGTMMWITVRLKVKPTRGL
jgi:hypothetical protein